MIGREQRFHPDYSRLEKWYISLFGVPVVGLRIRTRIVESLLPGGISPGMILDAGCGPGVITFFLARRYPAATVVGADLDREPVEACRVIAGRAGIRNAEFCVASLLELPWRDRFDLVVCVDILEHIEEDGRALGNLAGALAPGGLLLLHVPALYRRYPVFKKSVNFDVPTHVRPGYRVEEIVEKARAAGLEVVASGETYGFLETLANNASYGITRARKQNREIYALAFPLLNLLGWCGRRARPRRLGAGVYLLARKAASGGGQERGEADAPNSVAATVETGS